MEKSIQSEDEMYPYEWVIIKINKYRSCYWKL